MGDAGRGFFKLHEDGGSSRGSVFHTTTPVEGYGPRDGTRINLGFGRCLNLHVKAEKDDGSLRIGGLALASNCNHIVLIFGFFFLLAGAVLTSLAYKTKRNASDALPNSPGDEGRIAGPLFVVFGSALIIMGIGLTLVGWKVNQAAKRQLNHFSLQIPPPPTPETPEYYHTFNDSSYLQRSRRDSLVTPSFFIDRRTTLPTIAQAVPVGFFLDGRLSSGGISGHGLRVDNSAGERLTPPEAVGGGEEEDNLSGDSMHRKASLSFRPSLPIPIIASPSFIRSRVIAPLDPTCLMRTRSDEPYGSIVSLSGNGDIACFPAPAPPTPFAPCQEEDLPSEAEGENRTPNPSQCRETTEHIDIAPNPFGGVV